MVAMAAIEGFTKLGVAGPDGEIGVTTGGQGPPLVLVAGVGSTSRIWGDLPGLLASRFTVICPDNRGVGSSRTCRSFSLAGAADDLAAVLDGLGLERAAFLGVSMGGAICLQAAVRHPGIVDRMVVASCAARLSRHGRRMLELLAALVDALPPREVGPALMTLAFAPPFHETHPAFVAEAARLYGLDPADLPGTRRQLEHLLAGWDLARDLAGVATPTLVLAGERDVVVAPEDTTAVADALPRSEIALIPGAGHSVLAEGGGRVLDRVIGFLEGAA